MNDPELICDCCKDSTESVFHVLVAGQDKWVCARCYLRITPEYDGSDNPFDTWEEKRGER